MNALNPVTTIGAQFKDAMRAHGKVPDRDIAARSAEVLRMVGIDPVHLRSYPHQLSRRDAAARDDRDGPALHPRPGHHGRADLGAGRGGAAVADGADQGTAAGVRLRGRLRHPRHVAGQPLLRPADGDVRRPGGRDRRHPGGLRPARCTPTPQGLLEAFPSIRGPARPAERHPRQPARPGPACRPAAGSTRAARTRSTQCARGRARPVPAGRRRWSAACAARTGACAS